MIGHCEILPKVHLARPETATPLSHTAAAFWSHQFPGCPVTSFLPSIQRRCPKLALVNPRCGPVPCGSRVCLRPSRECFHVAPQPCNPRICLQASQDCIRIPQAPCSPRICLGPSQSLLQCCRLPTRYSSSLSRTLPLLSPIKRKSLCLSRSQPRRPCSK